MAKSKSGAVKSKTASKAKKLEINLEEIKKASLVLRSVNHKVRQNILKVIDTNKEIRVTDIYRQLKLEQSMASAYLALLRRAGVVTTRRHGQVIYYALNHKRLSEVEQGSKMINLTK